ncbi:MAG: 50S ribosomal protein L6, partial [Dehalococcoidia bacterium]
MSRIGKAPITVPSGVDVTVDGTTVSVKGKVGELKRTLPATMKIELNDGVITVARPNDEPAQRSLHG